MEESLPVKTIGDGPGSGSGSGSGSESTALARDGGPGGLISILKGLEIEKSLATDPVVVALRYYPATSGSFAPLPPELAPKLVEYLHGRGWISSTRTSGRLMTWRKPGRASW